MFSQIRFYPHIPNIIYLVVQFETNLKFAVSIYLVVWPSKCHISKCKISKCKISKCKISKCKISKCKISKCKISKCKILTSVITYK